MRTLDRYIIREMIGPTVLGFLFYTFMVLMQNLFRFAEMIIKSSLPLHAVLKLLALSIPHIVVLTVPMSLLVGILIAVGRLSTDSEIVAMRSCGISMGAIFRPVLVFSSVIFLVNVFLMNVILPRGNRALQDLKSEVFTAAAQREVTPRVIYEQFTNWVLYVNDADSHGGGWKGVFLADVSDPTSGTIIVAQGGQLSRVGDDKQIWAELNEASTHLFSPRRSDRYSVISNHRQRFRLLGGETGTQIDRSLSLREMNLVELIRESRRTSGNSPVEHRVALVEIHKKFSIPFACLAFGIIGLPLGITNRRGGKSSGFSLSLGIILIYYLMLNNGENLAATGVLPVALAMWFPNLVLVGIGLQLLRRANHVRAGGSSIPLAQRTAAFFRGVLPGARRKEGEPEREVDGESFLSRIDIAFPNMLDRYVLSEFLRVFGMMLVSAVALFVIVDYGSGIANEASKNHISYSLVGAYYRFFIIQVLNYALPISVLLSTLVAFGLLSKNSEIVAMKAHGISLYRIGAPVVVMAAIVCAVSYLLLDFVLPYSSQRVAELKAQIKGRQVRSAFDTNQQQWLFGRGRYLFNFLSYDRQHKSMSQVQVFEFDSDFRLIRRVWAEEARFDGIGWVFVNGWMRSFGPEGSVRFAPIVEPIRLHYPERPDYFERVIKKPEQMTFNELSRYVEKLETSGYDANEMRVKLYEKTAWPFLSLVMALIALPFAFRMGKQGALYGIGVALLLGFAYWLIFGVFTKFGEVGNLPAILSAWSANIAFSLAAIYLFLRVET